MFVYTATEVACGWGRGSDEKANPSYWAGVVMQKPLLNAKKADGDGQKEGKTDGRTDRGLAAGWPNRWTDGWTERADGETEKWNNRHSGLQSRMHVTKNKVQS